MKVRELAHKLMRIKEELQDKEIVAYGMNGIEASPEIKFRLKDKTKLDKTIDNVEFVAIGVFD